MQLMDRAHRTIRAAVACAERRIARCLLLGSPDKVAVRAGRSRGAVVEDIVYTIALTAIQARAI